MCRRPSPPRRTAGLCGACFPPAFPSISGRWRILALFFPASGAYVPAAIPTAPDSRALWSLFSAGFPVYFREVAVCLGPIAVFFAVFQVISLRLPRKKVLKIVVGLLYTYFGLVLFLTGVNVGFLPAGAYLGRQIAALSCRWVLIVLKIVVGLLYTYFGLVLFLTGVNVGFLPAGAYLGRQIAALSCRWVLIPIGMLMGWFIVQAEPAVHVLNRQVEEITSGAIPGKAMSTSLSIGVAISIGLAMTRVLTGISIVWFLVPGYLAALILSFLVPDMFTAIAFDSGGVASGPMTATFLLPFAMGACEALGGNVITDAFGVVAMVAMTPLLTIQLLGLLYQYKLRRTARTEEVRTAPEEDDIIDL